MQSTALSLAYSGYEKYKGVVYVMLMDKKTDWYKEYRCYIDKLPEMLEEWQVNNKPWLDVYITNNTFKSFKGRENNLFSYNSFVVDVDCHDETISITNNYTIMHNLARVLNEELTERIPIASIMHYTGRGLHLWWSFEQVSSELCFPYRITLARLIEEVKYVISKHDEFSCVKVDGTSLKETGYYRLFDTYNPKAAKKSLSVIQNEHIYKLQDLIDAVNQAPKIVYTYSNTGSKEKHVLTWDKFSIQNRRRMQLIESLVVDRNAPSGSETRNNYLYVYYSCARGIYGIEMAQKKAKQLNTMFKEPIKKLDYIFKHIDGRYEEGNPYYFKNTTLIALFNMTYAEQEKYDFWPAKEKDYRNKTRNAERKTKREFRDERIITLYLEGMTQEEVAEDVGCCRDTVRRLLKEKGINRKQANIRRVQVLKAEGKKQIEVAELLEIPYRTVQRYWNELLENGEVKESL